MKGAFLGILLALTPLGCTPATRQASQQVLQVAGQASKIEDCEDLKQARDRVRDVLPLLTKQQIELARAISLQATIHCTTTLPALTAQLNQLAEEAR